MNILADRWIKEKVTKYGMIEPFVSEQIKDGKISYGLSSYGYDFRIADEFKLVIPKPGQTMDPKHLGTDFFTDFKGAACQIPPNSFALGRSVEYFKIPRDVLCICTGKSTYARCGIVINVTPLEPEWEGFITVAIVNAALNPVKIYSNEGIGQVIFLETDKPCLLSYKDKQGKYQEQQGIILPKV